MMVSPSLAQLAFAVASGILVSSMVTARVLIPALAVIGGRRAWWPSRMKSGVGPAPASASREDAPEPMRLAA
jgi:RND superfamily putative drug exporter